jgi:hypothetical protein
MKPRHYLAGLSAAVAFGLIATVAQAAPAGRGVSATAAAAADTTSAAEKVAYRRCVRRDGARVCGWRSYYPYAYIPRVILGIAF